VTKIAPTPTLEEELVYMRDVMAVQTLRLDEAEQALERQSDLIDAQARQIAELQQMVNASQQMLASLGAAPSVRLAGGHEVTRGDTLSQIARRYNTTVAALAEANDLAPPYRLRIGQQLNVPGAAPAASARVAAAPAAPSAKIETPQEREQTAPQDAPQRVAAAQSVSPSDRPDVADRVQRIDEQRKPDEPAGATPETVGVRPDEEEEVSELAVFADIGGILTPGGTLFVEPGIDYATSSDNRFFFQGVEIADAILIGQIEATDSDREATTQSMTFRYGLTNRLEIDGRVSYVSRNDRINGVSVNDGTTIFRELGGYGIGDTSFGLHYQLNNGRRFPYTVLNLRANAPTGEGPFEVDRDGQFLETELATGSGFWTIEPSLSFLLPTSPAVIFANVGYQMNMTTEPNVAIGANTVVRELNPGDAIRTSIGVGLSLNEKLSLNFGYDQSHFLRTETLFAQTDDFGNVTLARS
ncbi:MAG: LysM peptidoglycan-binding domain-containing protein, partial [Hyphococcus sp.]